MRYLVVIFWILICGSATGQEDCTNGIDDDNDGLIDLLDDECRCLAPTGYNFLEDFENNVCCPQYFTTVGNPFGIECLNGMSAATVGTPDYFHTCGYLGSPFGPDPPPVPLPMPSGMGAGGIVVMNNYVEYWGTCLPDPLQAGVEYEFSVYVGFNTNNVFGSNSPILFNIYATNNCTNNYPSSQIFCLDQDPNWYVLGSMTVSGNIGEWVQVSTTVIPGSNVEAIAIGSPCNFASGNNYYFFDDFQIIGGGAEEIPVEDIVDQTGNCITGVTLTSQTYANAQYQWFYNGVAIAGATGSTYPVPPGEEGSYQVMITINGECGISDVEEVEIDEEVLDLDGIVSEISCYNAGDGSITLDLPGINLPLDIQWSHGESTPTITGLSQGNYVVTVTDAKGCFNTLEFELFNPFELELILDYVIQPGNGNPNGEAAVLIAGGEPGYTLQWSNGADGYKETALSPGHYSITVVDNNGCIDTVGFDIFAPFQTQLNYSQSSCLVCNGTINVTVNGGVEPVEVTIINLQSGETILGAVATGLCPNTYSYSITDGIGNVFQDTVDLGLLSAPEIKPDSIQNIICVGDSTGYISVVVAGGSPGYKYKWSHGDTTAVTNNLLPGLYALTVTDQQGCKDTVSYLLSSAPALQGMVNTTPVGCLTGGTASFQVSGGSGPYQWLWSTGDTMQMVTNLIPGKYTVEVRDSLGCSKRDSVEVIQQGGILVQAVTSDAHCISASDGAIEITPVSFNGSLSYAWSSGDTTAMIDSLQAGVYSVTLTDEIGCIYTQSYNINYLPPFEVTADLVNNLCNGDSTATITLTTMVGGQLSFLWTNGATGFQIEGLSEGKYTVAIVDQYGCEQIHTYDLTDPPALMLETTVDQPECAGTDNGSISMMASGGTGQIEYIINGISGGELVTRLGEGLFQIEIKDENSCIIEEQVVLQFQSDPMLTYSITEAPCGETTGSLIDVSPAGGVGSYTYNWSNGSTTEDLRDVPAGNYLVTVTDDLGCEIRDTIPLTNTDGPAVMVSGTDVACNGESNGQLSINATQGSPPYSIYINGSLVSTTEITDLAAGKYEVAVVDAKGCEIKTSYEIAEPPAIAGIIVVVVQPDINKTTGSASLEVSGGKEPYTIEWDNGEVGPAAMALKPGLHTVTITDSSGCKAEADVTIVKSAIYAIWEEKDNSCAEECKGEINITIQNADGTETIAWSDGGTGTQRTGLCAGEYQWTITDGYGNTKTSPVVTISTPKPLKLAVEVKGESCENKGDGQATVSINGGTPDYTIKWDGVTGTETTSLSTGVHTLVITDANGCLTDTVVLLPVLSSANITTEVKDAICESGGELIIRTSASEIIDVLINGTKYSIDKELIIGPLPPAMYKIEQQISDSCFVFKEEVIIENENFITGGSIQTEIEVKEGEQVMLDISSWQIAGEYTISWEGIQQGICEETDAYDNCLKYVYIPDGPHEVSVYILSAQGCDSLVTFNIRVLVDNEIFFPNVFGTETQPVFKPADKTGQTKVESFLIWDRWGNLVHSEQNLLIGDLRGWNGLINGNRAEQGVYVFDLSVLQSSQKIKHWVGDITLLR